MRPERGFGGLAGAALALTLAAAMLALFPATAGAQTYQGDRGARSVAVQPGDSLWSISEERLGPDATPRRVLKGAERIHALNRARIGADPDLLLAGQELLLPPAMSGRNTAETAQEAGPAERGTRGAKGGPPPSAPTKARTGGEAAGAGVSDGQADNGQVGRPAEPNTARAGIGAEQEGAEQAGTKQAGAEQAGTKQEGAKGVGSEIAKAEEVRPDAADRAAPQANPRVSLPDAARAEPVPAARGLAPDEGPPPSPFAPFLEGVGSGAATAASALAGYYEDADGRRLAGLAAMALGLSAAAFGAWRLLARRGGAPPPHGAWRPYYSPLLARPADRPHAGRPADRRGAGDDGARDAVGAPSENGAGRDRGPTGARAPAPGNDTGRVGLAGMARLKRRAVRGGRAALSAKRLPRRRLAAGAYAPEVRRSVRAARGRKGGRS